MKTISEMAEEAYPDHKDFDKIRAYTTIEQSRKLAEILPIESADMTYYACVRDWMGRPVKPRWGKPANALRKEIALPCANLQVYEYVSAWSLAALLSVLDYPQLSKDKLGSGKVGWMVSVYPNDCRYDSCWHDNPVDACYEMILKLHELNLL